MVSTPGSITTARQLHAHIADKRELADLLEAYAGNCGRHIPRREIEAAVRDSEATAWRPQALDKPQPAEAKPTWPKVNQEQREAVLRDGIGLADLWEASPVRLDDADEHTEAIVDQLFPGNPLLCVGQSNSVFDTKAREAWRTQLAGMQLIVPSPMSALKGRRKTRPEKIRCPHTRLSNTGPRRFLVIEFDSGSFDEHAALLWHLAQYAPLVLAVHSGSKSLHGWFYCARPTRGHVAPVHALCRGVWAPITPPGPAVNSFACRMAPATTANGKPFSISVRS